MQWVGFSGSWRKINKDIEDKIRKAVREEINKGNGIVSGGALNADYVALDEALKTNPLADKIKIFLPTTLKVYANHYRKHAKLGDITQEQAGNLINQLETLRKISPSALMENPDWKSYI